MVGVRPTGRQPCAEGPGILVDDELPMIQQCPGAKEANWILGCIGKRLREVILPLSFAL